MTRRDFICPQCGQKYQVGKNRDRTQPCRICQAENRDRQRDEPGRLSLRQPQFWFLEIACWALRVIAAFVLVVGGVSIGALQRGEFIVALGLQVVLLLGIAELFSAIRFIAVNIGRIRQRMEKSAGQAALSATKNQPEWTGEPHSGQSGETSSPPN